MIRKYDFTLYVITPTPTITGWWACHQGCRDYRGWRILSEDVSKIPLAFCFANWGLRDVWLEEIRQKRK